MSSQRWIRILYEQKRIFPSVCLCPQLWVSRCVTADLTAFSVNYLTKLDEETEVWYLWHRLQLYSVDTGNSMLNKSHVSISFMQPYLQCSSPRHRKIYWSPKLLPARMQITEMMFEISCWVSNKETIKRCLVTVISDSYLNYLCQRAWGLLCPPTPPNPAKYWHNLAAVT